MEREDRNKYELNRKRRQYPLLTPQEFIPQCEPMFPVIRLREAYEYWITRTNTHTDAAFFDWLCKLEKDVALNRQKYQP